MKSLQDILIASDKKMTGFDYLRLFLALFVCVWHTVLIGVSPNLDSALMGGNFRFIIASIIPVFFSLSGFLVAGSLKRTPRLRHFFLLRMIRLLPALAVEITLCALILGPLLTELPLGEYMKDEKFLSYFLNIVGDIHYELPGVFVQNKSISAVNAQLWTIPYELDCYLALGGLALIGFVKRRFWFVLSFIGYTSFAIYSQFTYAPIHHSHHAPGHLLVLCFLAGVLLFLYKEKVVFSSKYAMLSAVFAAVCVQYTPLTYMGALPISYLTIWIGTKEWPPISFGDLSYGIYLFHFPIEQTLIHIFPTIGTWYELSLLALPFVTGVAWASWNLIEKPILYRKYLIIGKIDGGIKALQHRFWRQK